MLKEERIIYTLIGLVAVAALISMFVKNYNPANGMQIDNTDLTGAAHVVVTNGARNSEFLTYNQPYAFSPPVANLLPNQASGMLGQKFVDYSGSTDNGCNCS